MGRAGAWRRVRAVSCALSLMVILLWSGLPAALSTEARAQEQWVSVRVPILTYHNVDYSGSAYSVTPETLDAHCRWLIENGYTSITLWQFWEAAFNGGSLPPNPVVLTNDDGWSSVMTFAEVLGRYGLVGNYFINNYSPLSADQIRVLAQNGPVQAHTANHPYMSQLDYAGQYAEIADNKAYIESITGVPVNFIAWPFGDRNASAIEAAASLGIIAGFGLGGTAAYLGGIEQFGIPRIMVTPDCDLTMFIAMVTSW
jgi:peptidoglycan/xylan/chitin deacetylase (PgdA/CDA1 family)